MKFTSTDERVFNAFCLVANESEFRSDITMAKIAQKMGISKQAINKYYYKNVNEIINALHYYVDQEVNDKIQNFINNKSNKKNLISFLAAEILPLLYKNREYLYVLYGEVADASWFKFIKMTYSPIIEPYIANFIDCIDIDSQFLASIIIKQVIAIIGEWLSSPLPENPLTFQKKFIYLMLHSTSELIDMNHLSKKE